MKNKVTLEAVYVAARASLIAHAAAAEKGLITDADLIVSVRQFAEAIEALYHSPERVK